MAEKIGIYFDEASVNGMVNFDALAQKLANKWGDTCPVVKSHPNLASDEGRKLIQADIDAGTIDGVCICGTSPRMDWDLYDFGSNVVVDRVNLREICVYAYRNPDGSELDPSAEPPELLQEMARDYINMGVVKLRNMNIPNPEELDSVKRVLVLGGGWSGLTAAVNAAQAGYEVVVVEKDKQLGGYAGKMHKTIPFAAPYAQAHETGVEQKISAVQGNDKITVYTGSKLEKVAGQPGDFEATLNTGSGQETVKVGAVVVATGWAAQDDKFLAPFGYGSLPNVVTSMQVEEMAKEGTIKRPSDGKTPKSVLFLTGFGDKLEQFAEEEKAQAEAEAKKAEQPSDDEEPAIAEEFKKTESYRHLPYTSEITSLTALKQARYVREMAPASTAYMVYEHMMVPGVNELYYKSAQDDPGIMLTKGDIGAIKEGPDGKVQVEVFNTLIGEDILLEVDMLVVPTAMVPTTALEPVIQLQYRQGEAFPDLELFDGFADSNYICFPYETRRTGIYAAGSVRQPMTLATSETDALGAALKSIQCIESVNRGMAVHPRSGDMTYPIFNFTRCTQCKRCTEECPFGALDDDEKGTPLPNLARCRRCGTCMGACPERVISFDNYGVGQIGSMIREINVPDEMETDGPRILVLACENDAYPALDMAAMRGKHWSPYVRFIPVRCLGSVNTIWVADAMGKGIDGVLLLGCKYGDDYQCHFVKGSELCSRRMQNIGETLDRLGVEKERVVQKEVAIDDYNIVPELIDSFVDYVTALGPNPYKGF